MDEIPYSGSVEFELPGPSEGQPHRSVVSKGTKTANTTENNNINESNPLQSLISKLFNHTREKRNDNSGAAEQEIKVFKRRFWMMFLYLPTTAMTSILWIQYASISNIIQCYYHVDAYAVNWTSTIFLVGYLILFVPMSWFLDRFGLKYAIVLGALFNCLSTITQIIATHPSKFNILFVAQTFATACTALTLFIPPKLAASWFGPNEVCRATAVGVFGSQIGNAVGFIIPALVVSSDCTKPDDIEGGLKRLAYGLTATNVINLILLIFTFQNKPPLPPSEVSRSEGRIDYKKSFFSLLRHRNFHWLTLTYGLHAGVTIAVSTLLNQILSPIYKNSEQKIGWIGLCQIMSGIVGSIICGYVLDATHKFKLVSLIINIFGLLSTALFLGFLYVKALWVHFIAVSFIGFFLNSFYSVGFEFACEITYPEPMGMVASIMTASTMLLGFVCTMVGSHLEQTYGILGVGLFLCAALIVASISCANLKQELKRTTKNMEQSNIQSTDTTSRYQG